MPEASDASEWQSYPRPVAFRLLAEKLRKPISQARRSSSDENHQNLSRFIGFKLLDHIQMNCLPKAVKQKGKTKFDDIAHAFQKYEGAYKFNLNEDNNAGRSGRFSSLFDGAKRGFSADFTAIILNIVWDNYQRFSIFQFELSGVRNFNVPVNLDDYDSVDDWASAALLQLHFCFGDGHESAAARRIPAPAIRRRTSDRIEARKNDRDLAIQRIAYDKRVKKGYVSYRELRITDIPKQLFELENLNDLHIGSTDIKSVPSLSTFKKLRRIDCSYTLITNINFLNECNSLKNVFLASTHIKSLKPIKSASKLQSLHIGNTQISDLSPLEGMKHLEVLHCEDTPVSDLEWVRECKKLRQLKLSNTKITDLSPLLDLPNLEELFLSGCHISEAPLELWTKPSLQRVYMSRGSLMNLPPIHFSKDDSDNCRDRIADFMNVRDEKIDLLNFNVFVLGNGVVGKTQLVRLLREESYNERIGSTHAIECHSEKYFNKDKVQYTLNFWDFGGQDIYHGIHSLFLKHRAIYILAWNPDQEVGEKSDRLGFTFPNRPLPYWSAYAETLGGDDSRQIHVQTKFDLVSDSYAPNDQSSPTRNSHGWPKSLEISAKESPTESRAILLTALSAAVDSISLYSPQPINRKWVEVGHDIAAIRATDPEKWFLNIEEFSEICQTRNVEDKVKTVLHYMDRTGDVIYRENINPDMIIINVISIVGGMYAVTDREHGCFDKIKSNRGCFTISNVSDWVWSKKYSENQEKVFLDLMELYGICFASHSVNEDVVYILPTALPKMPSGRLWKDGWHSIIAEYGFKGLHDGFIQGLICRIGRAVRISGDYWQTGMQVTIAENDCRFQLICEPDGDLNGTVKLEVQFMNLSDRRAAQGRLREFVDMFEQQEQATGLYAATRPAEETWADGIYTDTVFDLERPFFNVDCGERLFKKIQSLSPSRLVAIQSDFSDSNLESEGFSRSDQERRLELIHWTVSNGAVSRLEESIDRILAEDSSTIR